MAAYRSCSLFPHIKRRTGAIFLLNTNVVSEVMRPAPPPKLIARLIGVDASELYLSTFSIADSIIGLALIPPGQHRQLLGERFAAFPSAAFTHRMLFLNDTAAPEK